MAGKRIELGATGQTVADNVERFRRGMTYTDLSKRLAAIGRDIPALALRRIEQGDRRVDADDLLALALALGVSPANLLMPVGDETDLVSATGFPEDVAAQRLWAWLTADDAAPQFNESRMMFIYRACLPWVAGRKDRENAEELMREINEGRYTPRKLDGDDQ
jgi:transcriptional regulator with XRE-family HTH domain